MTRILASASPGEIRLAVLSDDTLQDYTIWRPGAPDGLGDVHIGRVTARVPAMAGAFVALADTIGFLPDTDASADVTEGTVLAVRVTRAAQGGKGPRLAAAHDLGAPSGQPRLIGPGPSPLARLAQLYPDAEVVVDDPALHAQLRATLPHRLTLAARAFDDATEAEVETLSAPFVDLPGGMRATIAPTPALTAIDIDGGATTAARGEKSGVQMDANRAALPSLAHQIRLRNLSGAILIDLAGIPIKRRPVLGPDLTASLARDPARPRLLGFSKLGFAEILRPRLAPPLHELLAGPLAAGLAALRAVAAEPTNRATLRAAPAVVAALQADPVALPYLARRATYPLILRSDPTLPPSTWIIEDAP